MRGRNAHAQYLMASGLTADSRSHCDGARAGVQRHKLHMYRSYTVNNTDETKDHEEVLSHGTWNGNDDLLDMALIACCENVSRYGGSRPGINGRVESKGTTTSYAQGEGLCYELGTSRYASPKSTRSGSSSNSPIAEGAHQTWNDLHFRNQMLVEGWQASPDDHNARRLHVLLRLTEAVLGPRVLFSPCVILGRFRAAGR